MLLLSLALLTFDYKKYPKKYQDLIQFVHTWLKSEVLEETTEASGSGFFKWIHSFQTRGQIKRSGDSNQLLVRFRNPPKHYERFDPEIPLIGPEYRKRKIERLVHEGHFDELEQTLSQYQEAFEKNTLADKELVDAYEGFKIPSQEFEKKLLNSNKMKPASYMAKLALTQYYMNLGLSVRGMRVISDVSSGQFEAMSRYFNTATQFAGEALEIKQDLPVAYIALISMETACGTEKRKHELIEESTSRCPNSLRLYARILWALKPRWGGSYEAMKSFINQYCLGSSAIPELRVLQGYILCDKASILAMSAGQASSAEERTKVLQQVMNFCNQALDFGELEEYYMERAEAYLASLNFVKSLEDYTRVTELSPHHETGLMKKPALEFCLSRFDQAFTDARKAVSIWSDGNHMEHAMSTFAKFGEFQLSVMYSQGNFREGLLMCDTLTGITPRHAAIYYWRGLMNQNLKQIDAALADYSLCIKLDPEYFEAYRGLDYILFKRRELKKILKSWNAYLAIRPEDARGYFERSGTHHHAGDKIAALKDLEKAASLGSVDAKRQLDKINRHKKLSQSLGSKT